MDDITNTLRKYLMQIDLPDKMDNVYIFGTGCTVGLYAKGLERVSKFKVKGYCVTEPKTDQYNGCPVFSVNEIMAKEFDPIILECS